MALTIKQVGDRQLEITDGPVKYVLTGEGKDFHVEKVDTQTGKPPVEPVTKSTSMIDKFFGDDDNETGGTD